ncbi:DUF2867 domain-containing protein [Nocardioides sp.]|uniref:DUF2867 domain-containing protein n=1 Tax=Nocardioides sp. TaxID=35761 RepID=UPI003D12C966
MEPLIISTRPGVRHHQLDPVGPGLTGRVFAIPLPTTPLLTDALPYVDWSDAYAVLTPLGAPCRDPQEWAEAIFQGPALWVRALFGVRELVVRLVGIEPGGGHAFATVNWRRDEVLVGTDQRHLGFRASVLVEPGRVALSTVVQVRNRRGRGYFALVRRIHPWVVRSMLARASRTMAGPS